MTDTRTIATALAAAVLLILGFFATSVVRNWHKSGELTASLEQANMKSTSTVAE